MSKTWIILLFVLLFLIFSCRSQRKTGKYDRQPSICLAMDMLGTPPDSLRIDPFHIDSLRIEDQCLNVYVTYGGGCGEARFNMFYSNMVQHSFPPQTTLYLAFEDNDHCRSIERKKLKFDLFPFSKYADNGGIWLNIAMEGQNRILYKNTP